MILWKSAEEPEMRPKMPCTAFRWTFQVRGFKNEECFGFDVGLVHQHKLDGKWYDGHDEYLIIVSSKMNFGQEHVYYDCPHCTYSFGPFTYFRGADWTCKKCLPDACKGCGGC